MSILYPVSQGYSVAEEATLIQRARQLDADTLAQIHDEYYGSIFRYVAFRVNDRETAEDLTSEVFLRFLKALRERGAPQTTIRGWLFGVAANLVNDHYRRGYRAPQTELTDTIESSARPVSDQVEAELQHAELRQAITTLTEDQQQVLALRFGQDLPIQAVARTLGKTEGSIKQLQARAIAALARRMQPGMAE